jgi:hypothetical protein
MAFSPVGALNWMRTANQNYREDKLARENLIARREDALLSLYIKNGGEYKNTKTGKTYNDAAKNALLLQDRVNNHLEDTNDPDLLEFYNNILEDPMAASEVLEFINSQEKDFDRIISIQDVPQYINIVNAPDIPVQEKIDIFKELELADLTDKEEYYELASKIQNMTNKSGRTVFTDVVPGSGIKQEDVIKRAEAMYGMMTGLLVPVAETWLNNAPDPKSPQATRTMSELRNLESPDEFTKAKARKYLFETYTTPEFVSNLEKTMPTAFKDLSKIPQIVTLFQSQKPLKVETASTVYPTPKPESIAALINNPTEEMIAEFNRYYGPNKAANYL